MPANRIRKLALSLNARASGGGGEGEDISVFKKVAIMLIALIFGLLVLSFCFFCGGWRGGIKPPRCRRLVFSKK